MAKNLFFKYENRFTLIQQLPTGHHSLKLTIILEPKIEKTSRKWLTVAIFRKWQDSSVALWIEIAVILNWR